jgi:NAD(P)-dependent dehydrogenase (short-subunit alcohol dehydrogenase family)
MGRCRRRQAEARKLPECADRGTSGDVLQHAFSADTLRDRVAIVTGASQGIGRAVALELAKVGAHVVACSRRRPAVDAVADDVRALGRKALSVACDVGDATQVDEVVARTLAEFGRVDLLVNNAGYRIRARLEDLPRAEWDAMIATNLTGVFLFSQAVGRVMIRQHGGKIVNVTSVAGRSGSRGMAAYAAAKSGVTALTQSLGAEWAKYGITVNAVAPGPTETEGVLEVWKTPAMIAQASREVPLQRLARPEEIAWAVIFVASDAANFMTGETLYVSGGPRVANRED